MKPALVKALDFAEQIILFKDAEIQRVLGLWHAATRQLDNLNTKPEKQGDSSNATQDVQS